MRVFWLVLLLLVSLPCICPSPPPATAAGSPSSVAKPGCSDSCGNVTVPYPFGIHRLDCAMNKYFLLNCTRRNASNEELIFGTNIPVLNVSVEEGIFTASLKAAYEQYNETRRWFSNRVIRLGRGPFTFSDTRNMFTAFGCDTLAYMREGDRKFGSGCISVCQEIQRDACSGLGCCQTSIPKGIKKLNISMRSASDYQDPSQYYKIRYAFLVDGSSFNISDFKPFQGISTKVAVEWVISQETCKKARLNSSTYACGREINTMCVDSENGGGYRCSCKDGFRGNPYLSDGCQDIDECLDPKRYPCHGTCSNTIGNYTCRCPFGMHGDGKVSCQGFRITTIFAVVGSIVASTTIGVLITIICNKRRKEKNFLQNGGLVLKNQRVRIFREAELAKATKNYDRGQFLGEGGFGSVYKGVLADNSIVAVKKPKDLDKAQLKQEFQSEIGIVSQVNHKNVVKLLGLCLETKVPLLVYEYISNGTLFEHIHRKKSQILSTWKSRLRIAAETALALDYLHSLADPPIIHGDVKSMNILLDENGTAKVSDFGASVLISPDHTDVATKVKGTLGYLDPEYLMTGILTEMSDVYSFGVVLVELLTGEKPNHGSRSGEKRGEKSNIIQYFISAVEKNNLSELICFDSSDDGELEEVEMVAELARRCLNSSGLRRPAMKEVAEELARLKKLHDGSWAQQNSEETEHLLGESTTYSSIDISSIAKIKQPTTLTLSTFGIEYYTDSI